MCAHEAAQVRELNQLRHIHSTDGMNGSLAEAKVAIPFPGVRRWKAVHFQDMRDTLALALDTPHHTMKSPSQGHRCAQAGLPHVLSPSFLQVFCCHDIRILFIRRNAPPIARRRVSGRSAVRAWIPDPRPADGLGTHQCSVGIRSGREGDRTSNPFAARHSRYSGDRRAVRHNCSGRLTQGRCSLDQRRASPPSGPQSNQGVFPDTTQPKPGHLLRDEAFCASAGEQSKSQRGGEVRRRSD